LLAGGMAHHYNNLLMAIQGNAELAMMSSSDSALKYLSVILDMVARAAKLTRQMLAFSRKQMLQTSVLNLNDLIAGLIDKVSQIMGNAVKVEWSPAAQLEPVHADAHALEQIVLELAQNARDAMPDDSGTGTLRISTEMVRLDADSAAVRAGAQPGRYVLLSVSDTGLGMNEQVQEHLFEPFFTTKAVGKGTGLALPMAYGIIRQLDGWIDVTSEPGKGARFEIYLPIRIQFERETNPV